MNEVELGFSEVDEKEKGKKSEERRRRAEVERRRLEGIRRAEYERSGEIERKRVEALLERTSDPVERILAATSHHQVTSYPRTRAP